MPIPVSATASSAVSSLSPLPSSNASLVTPQSNARRTPSSGSQSQTLVSPLPVFGLSFDSKPLSLTNFLRDDIDELLRIKTELARVEDLKKRQKEITKRVKVMLSSERDSNYEASLNKRLEEQGNNENFQYRLHTLAITIAREWADKEKNSPTSIEKLIENITDDYREELKQHGQGDVLKRESERQKLFEYLSSRSLDLLNKITLFSVSERNDFIEHMQQEQIEIQERINTIQMPLADLNETLVDTSRILRSATFLRNLASPIRGELLSKMVKQPIDLDACHSGESSILINALEIGDPELPAVVFEYAKSLDDSHDSLTDTHEKSPGSHRAAVIRDALKRGDSNRVLVELMNKNCLLDIDLISQVRTDSKLILEDSDLLFSDLFDESHYLNAEYLSLEENSQLRDAYIVQLIKSGKHDNAWPELVSQCYSEDSLPDDVWQALQERESICRRDSANFNAVADYFTDTLSYLLKKCHGNIEHYQSKLQQIFSEFTVGHIKKVNDIDDPISKAKAIAKVLLKSEAIQEKTPGLFGCTPKFSQTEKLIKRLDDLDLDFKKMKKVKSVSIMPEKPKNKADLEQCIANVIDSSEHRYACEKRRFMVCQVFNHTLRYLSSRKVNDGKYQIMNDLINQFVTGRLTASDLARELKNPGKNNANMYTKLSQHTSEWHFFRKAKTARILDDDLKRIDALKVFDYRQVISAA